MIHKNPSCFLISGPPYWIRHFEFLCSVVMDPCFIHCHKPHKKSCLMRWNSSKQRSESSTRCCFWSTVSKRGINFEQSFLMVKCSCKMVNTLPSDIFKVSAISRNFNFHYFENSKSSVIKTTVTCELNVKLAWNFDTYRL